MNTAERKRILILVSLLALLGLSLFYNGSRKPAPARMTQESKVQTSPTQDPLPLREILDQEPKELTDVHRNIFEFEGEEFQDTAKIPGAFPPGGNTDQEIAQIPAPPVIPDVHYLGFYLEKENMDQKMAAISNTGKIWVGRVGDVLGGKYKILRIDAGYVLIELVSDSSVLKLPLGKKGGEFVSQENEK